MKAPLLLTALTLFSAAFTGCSNSDSKKIEVAPSAKATEAGQPQNLTLNFKDPVVIDSTDYVMYPLAINKSALRGDDYIKLSSSSSGSQVYWNIVFYNMATKTHHLLDDKRKMVITSYNPYSRSTYNDEGALIPEQKGNEIFYSVIVDDYNKDGNLDLEDPTYLFICDKKGNNFVQISPDNVNVFNWKVVRSTGKVLINAAADTNNDKKFDQSDDTTPYIYDFKTGGIAQPVLDKNFIDTAEKLFTKHWKPKVSKE